MMIEMSKKQPGKIVQTDNVRPFKTPGQKRQLRILLIVLASIVVLAIAAYFFIMPKEDTYRLMDYDAVIVRQADLVQTTQASGAVAIPLQLDVLSPETGYADKLFVTEGDYVNKDDVLATLSAPELADQLEDQRSALEDARLNLKKIETQNQFSIDKIKREIVSLEKDIAESRADISKLEELVAISASRKSDLESTQKILDDLLDQLSESKISLRETTEVQQIDMQIRRADLAQQETKLARLLKRVEELGVKAPMKGEILELESSLNVPGSLISTNQFLFTISDPASAIVELEVLEDYAGLLHQGQEIQLTVSGLNLPAEIISIGKIAQASSDGLGATVQIKVKPTKPGEILLAGSTASGTIELGKKEQTLLIPRGPYLTTGSQKYLYKIDGNKAVRVAVVFGEIQGNEVEILSGVAAGDKIITSGYQNFIQYKEIVLTKGE